MPETARPRRRPLKVYPSGDEMLLELVRALNRIADGVEDVVDRLDALTVTADSGELALRTVPQ